MMGGIHPDCCQPVCMKRALTKLFFLVGVVFLLRVASVSAAEDWQAGVARVKITPDQPMWLSGKQQRNRPAQGMLHDLWAKALALQDPAGQRAVLITMDLVGIDRDL